MIYVGIDPGVNGGIAMLSQEGGIVSAVRMPETDRDVLDALTVPHDAVARAVLEFVRASPKMGTVSAFTFGRGYGRLRMALAAIGIPYDEVVPTKWQRAMACRSGGDKNVTKRRAQELFPIGVKITHNISDALLLAEYCRRLHCGISAIGDSGSGHASKSIAMDAGSFQAARSATESLSSASATRRHTASPGKSSKDPFQPD